jgi:hypothetical protein
VFGIAFSIIGLLPSIASVLFYAIPNGGGPAMVWGVSSIQMDLIFRAPDLSTLVASSQYFHSPRWDVNGGTGLSCSNIWRGTSRQRDFSHPTIQANVHGIIAILLDVFFVLSKLAQAALLDSWMYVRRRCLSVHTEIWYL